MLTVLTQKPPFSTGNLRLLTLAATLEAACRRNRKLPILKTGISPTGSITACSRFPHRVDIATGSVCGSSVLQRPRKLRNGHMCLMLPPGEP
jgi:hypothetical protein